jgi:cytosine/adenosine deaminase-related metal-dependent hydrolase
MILRPALPIPAALLVLSCAGTDGGRETVDLLISGGTVITMDSARRILDDGAVAITGNRIVAVGPAAELSERYSAAQVIDATRKVVMPGLIDGHGHAGHGLVKTLGADIGEWNNATERIYANGSTTDFWRAEALLTGVERVRFGVTTALSYFGGGDMVVRTDDPRYGDAYLQAIQDVGVRFFLAVGPRRPPFPRIFTEWEGESSRDVSVTFERQLEVSEELIRKWHGAADGRLNLAVMFPTIDPSAGSFDRTGLPEIKRQAQAMRDLSRRHGLLFTQDGHTTGTVQFAHEELNLLGTDVIFSHSTDLTQAEIDLLVRTGTRIVHNPSAIAAIRRPFQLVEMLDAGVLVMLGSDGVAPDRSYDMFRHMFQAMRYHRARLRDASVVPAGKVLEMVTIDAAKALGIDSITGSLEPGKRADVILVDMFRPHLVPMNMPAYRIAYFANGNDVSTVIVDGRILMRDRQVLSVNETEVLELAEREAEAAIRRTGLERLKDVPEGFWGRSRLR